jgi:hypothetical protein
LEGTGQFRRLSTLLLPVPGVHMMDWRSRVPAERLLFDAFFAEQTTKSVIFLFEPVR